MLKYLFWLCSNWLRYIYFLKILYETLWICNDIDLSFILSLLFWYFIYIGINIYFRLKCHEMWNTISYVSILQLYKGVSLNNVSSYFPGKFLWGKSKFVMVVEISNVLPALLTIKVDIALSKRYSRQPQASNRKLMTRLCMCHCSCANFFRGKKSCQILSSFDLCMLEMFMLWIFTITMLLYT